VGELLMDATFPLLNKKKVKRFCTLNHSQVDDAIQFFLDKNFKDFAVLSK
jgi:hypothetical protein